MPIVRGRIYHRLGLAPGFSFISRARDHGASTGWRVDVHRQAHFAVRFQAFCRIVKRRRRGGMPITRAESDQPHAAPEPYRRFPSHEPAVTGKWVWLIDTWPDD